MKRVKEFLMFFGLPVGLALVLGGGLMIYLKTECKPLPPEKSSFTILFQSDKGMEETILSDSPLEGKYELRILHARLDHPVLLRPVESLGVRHGTRESFAYYELTSGFNVGLVNPEGGNPSIDLIGFERNGEVPVRPSPRLTEGETYSVLLYNKKDDTYSNVCVFRVANGQLFAA